MRGGKWLNVAALVTWLICGLSQIVAIGQRELVGWPAVTWLLAYLLYGAALILFLGVFRIRPRLGYYAPLALVIVQMVSALVVVMLPVVYLRTTNSTPGLLVVIAAQVPYLAPRDRRPDGGHAHITLPRPWIWSILGVLTATNTALLFAAERSWDGALSYGLSIGGFMLFAAASSFLVQSEGAARDELATVNTELLGTRAQLAESSRVEERLRISRDLHDTLGHHLTALSLQLDVAARLSEGKAVDHIRQAHAITRLLLGDVRDVVSRLRESTQFDLAQAIRAMASERSDPADELLSIHLDLPDTLNVEESLCAETLLRCVQEIITNTTRHAHARNLWIRLEAQPEGIALHARDDGRGADAVQYGNGLTGMRERFEQHAGRIEVRAGQGTGFEIRGFLPRAAAA